jgi:F0F1-type ATP synthase assembly protein I
VKTSAPPLPVYNLPPGADVEEHKKMLKKKEKEQKEKEKKEKKAKESAEVCACAIVANFCVCHWIICLFAYLFASIVYCVYCGLILGCSCCCPSPSCSSPIHGCSIRPSRFRLAIALSNIQIECILARFESTIAVNETTIIFKSHLLTIFRPLCVIENDEAGLDKRIKALKKKIRQINEIKAKKAEGKPLDSMQEEKLEQVRSFIHSFI